MVAPKLKVLQLVANLILFILDQLVRSKLELHRSVGHTYTQENIFAACLKYGGHVKVQQQCKISIYVYPDNKPYSSSLRFIPGENLI